MTSGTNYSMLKTAPATGSASANDSGIDLSSRNALGLEFVDALESGVYLILDNAGNITNWNDTAESFLGYSKKDIIGRHFSCLYAKPAAVAIQPNMILDMVKSGRNHREQTLVAMKDGEEFHAEIEISCCTPVNNEPPAFLMYLRDDSKLFNTQTRLELNNTVFQALGQSVLVTDADGYIVMCNRKFNILTGLDQEEINGKNIDIVISYKNDKELLHAQEHAIKQSGTWQGELWVRSGPDNDQLLWVDIVSLYDELGEATFRIYTFEIVSDEKNAERKIWQQANFDHVTRLPNRNMFMEKLSQTTIKSDRSGLPFSLIFMDLDYFKNVNDELGHDQGDILLKEVANRIKSCLRLTDTASRIGGDEFTIIMDELEDVYAVERVTTEILKKINTPFKLAQKDVTISSSIGVTFYPKDGKDVAELMKNADQAMYSAKQHGRSQISYFTQSMQDSARKRTAMITAIRSAVEQQDFILHYQPIIDMTTGNICKAEALLRWEHPLLGEVKPDSFIHIAENCGVISKIGNWVFNQALQMTNELRSSVNPDFQVSINSSPAQFKDNIFDPKKWAEQLKQRGLPGESLIIEITENLFLESNQVTNQKLGELSAANMPIAIDDFGTGYSSLSYLKKFDVDYLKIDRSFVSTLEKNKNDLVLCEAMILMAHKLGIKVVAEGVETEEQLSLLKDAGLDYAQGYLFSKPVPADDFFDLIIKFNN